MTPYDYGLNLPSFRPHQGEMIESLLSKPDGSVTILEAPTGSGKSPISKAVGYKDGVTTLVKTKLLQQENYEKSLGMDILFGKANYRCVHPDVEGNADLCLYEGEMDSCEYAHRCPYLKQKKLVQASRQRSLNYSLFLTSYWCRQPKHATRYLFIDECHMLSDEVVEWVGTTVRQPDRLKYRLPEFPDCYASTSDNVDKVLSWMSESKRILYSQASLLKGPEDQERHAKIVRFMDKLSLTQERVEVHRHDWYVRSGLRALDDKPGLVIKPLTARHHFPDLFLGAYPRVVLMSATIGDPKTFAEELGIEDRYQFEQIPNQWPPESRPVEVLPCPVIGYSSPDSYYVKQAELIAKSLQEAPGDWQGVIHVNSWSQAEKLHQRLCVAFKGHRRLFVPTRGGGTNSQMAQWEQAKRRGKGMIILTPSMSEGVDLKDERICIIAKIPFPPLQPGSFDYERMQYSRSMYLQRTSWKVEQMAGRTRRGRPEDYDTSWEKRGFVAIADGAFIKQGVRKYCSKDFQDALVIRKS